MADETKKYLINIESNIKKYAEDAVEAKKKIDELTAANKELKKSGQEGTVQYEANRAAIKALTVDYNHATNSGKTLRQELKAQEGSYEKLLRQYEIASVKLKTNKDAIIKNADGVYILSASHIKAAKEVDNMKRGIDSFGTSIHDNRLNVANYGEAVKGAFVDAGKNILSMIGPMALVGAAIAAAKKIFEGLKEAIMSTTFGMDTMNKIGAVTKQLWYDIAINGKLSLETLISASKIQGELNALRIRDGFEILQLSKINREEQAVREESIDRTKTHAERLVLLNKVIDLENQKTKIKVGNLTDELNAKEKLLKQQPANEKLMLNIIDLKAKINDTYAEEDAAMRRVNTQRTGFMQEEIDNRKKLFDAWYKEIDAQNEATDKAAKQQIKDKIELALLESKGDLEATKKALKYKFDQDIKENEITNAKKLTLKIQYNEVIKALDQTALAEYEKIENKKKDVLKSNLTEQIKTIERDKELKAVGLNKVQLLELEKQSEDKILKLRINYINSTIAIDKDITDKKKTLLKSQFDEDLKGTENNDIKKKDLEEKYQSDILIIDQAAVINSQNLLQQEVDAYVTSIEKKKAADIAFAEWDKERQLVDQENNLKIRELNNEWEFSLQKDALKLQYDAEIANAEKTGADIKIIKEKYAAIGKEIDRLEADAKWELAAGFAGNLVTIFGKETALGKAAAIAETTINTYRSAQAAFASLAGVPLVGPILGATAAAAAITAGIANIKKIVEVKIPGGGGGETPSVSMPSAPPAPAAPRTFAKPVETTPSKLTQAQLNALPQKAPTVLSSLPVIQQIFVNQTGSNIFTQIPVSQMPSNVTPQQKSLTADDIANALSKMPAPIVTVEDINARAESKRKVEVRATV